MNYNSQIFYTEKSSLILIEKNTKKRKLTNKLTLVFSIFLIIDLFILYINIHYVFKKNGISENSYIFKNVDLFSIEKITKPYMNFTYYLKSKFMNNKVANKYLSDKKPEESKEKKKIVIYFADLYNRDFRQKWIQSALGDKFNIEFDSENPDYVFYNVFGCDHLNPKYKNAIKIAQFSENQIVDFDVADYAIGQHHINYFDRYFRRPFFIFQLFNLTNKNFSEIRQKVIHSPMRTKFCAGVISNTGWTDGFRRLFYKELNKYKEIGMGGLYHNNVGGPVRNKIKFLTNYKFSLAMENTKADGYITEKIIDAFLAGNIPIYYGNYMIEEYINPKAFILIKGEEDMMEKIEYIKKIDNDDKLYKSILREKVLINDNIQNDSAKGRIEFLNHIFEQNKTFAKRVDNYHYKE